MQDLISFHRFSTAGNTTLLVRKPCDLRAAMKMMAAEQGGVADTGRASLRMGGGELCINATLACAVLFSILKQPAAVIHTADLDLPVWVKGNWQGWLAGLELGTSLASISSRDDCMLVRWPGITHAFIKCSHLPHPGRCARLAKYLMKKEGLESEPAAGVTWWTQEGVELQIRPVVHVPALDTFFLEAACGSASASLALILGKNSYRIRQYSGEYINVSNQEGCLQIEAPIKLLDQGKLRRHADQDVDPSPLFPMLEDLP